MPSTIARRIKEARVKAGLTQKELASRLHVGQSACANWEKGIREPEITTICDLCGVLGVSADYLLGLPERGVSLTNSNGNAVNSASAQVVQTGGLCRDCPHLTRLIGLLSARGETP